MKDTSFLSQQSGLDKIKRYDWVIPDVQPGELLWIHKTKLEIDHKYQRECSKQMTSSMSSKWSWIACGVLTVAHRPDGSYCVIDGQHRLRAALNRSDITNLPCIVFKLDSIATEAKGFVDSDTFRRNILSLDKFKAQKEAMDSNALYLQSIFDRYGIKPSASKSPKSIKSLSTCYALAKIDQRQFENLMELISVLCMDEAISEKLLTGLDYLSKHLTIPITDKKLRMRILDCGASKLEIGAIKAAAYYAGGGGKVFAIGMLEIINKGLRKKYAFRDEIVE